MTARSHLLPAALVGGSVLALLLVPAHVDLHIALLGSSGLLGHAVDGGTPLWWLLEDLSNVAMFLPVGWVLARVARPWLAAVGGCALSSACELAQHWIPNRDASLIDVAMNATGTLLGVGIAVVLRRRAYARRDAPQRAQDQKGTSAVVASGSMAVRQRPQFGVSSAIASSSASASARIASASSSLPTGTW